MTALQVLDRTIRLVRDVISDEVPNDAVVNAFQSFRIRCLANKLNLLTHAGQTALVTFVSLVARMGVQIDLDIPEVGLAGPQPPLRGAWLREGLIDLAGDLIPESRVTTGDACETDLLFVFGDTPFNSEKIPYWRVTGTAWAGRVNDDESEGAPWVEDWPIGAMTAAALAAPEVFKSVVRTLPLRNDFQACFLQPVGKTTWDFGKGCPRSPEINFGPLDIISAGAITQALIFVLLRLPHASSSARVFDHDVAESSNLNRSMITRFSDTGLSKVAILASYATPDFKVIGIPERFQVNSAFRHLPLAPHVLVGVDDIPSRWEAQQATTGWLGIGGTSHFQTSTSSHEAGQPCGGCLHPFNDDQFNGPLPTISFVSFWAGLALAVRLLHHLIGQAYDDRQQHLWLVPLRMDNQHAALWFPVAARSDCPVGCAASRAALEQKK